MSRPGGSGRRTPQGTTRRVPAREAARPARAGSRPRTRSRAVAGGADRPVRPRFTGRAAILLLVAAVLVVSYASSLRAWLDQRSQIAQSQAQIVSSEREIARLEREKKRWHDRAYVEAQGRQVLGWVLPGEVSYQVIGRDGKPLQAGRRLPDADSVVPPLRTPWWSKAYESLQQADHPEQPATTIRPDTAP